MIKLSKKVEYGLIALVHMDSMSVGEVVSAKDLGACYHIPADLLGKVLQTMARAGLIESVHGAHGGYRLERSLDGITVGEVIEVIDGPVTLSSCQEDPDGCSQFCFCTIRQPVMEVQSQLNRLMYGIKMSTFRKDAAALATEQRQRNFA